MRCKLAVGIKAHFARAKQQARIANVMHHLFLLGAEFLLDPQELTLARKILQQFLLLQIRKDSRQFSRNTLLINHLQRLRIKRMGFKVHRKNAAVSVCDISALRLYDAARCRRAWLARFRRSQHAHTCANNAERAKEHHREDQ